MLNKLYNYRLLAMGFAKRFIDVFFMLPAIILLTVYILFIPSVSIADYQEAFIPGHDKQGNLQIVIRTYNIGSLFKFLVVNPNTFETGILEPSEFFPKNHHTHNANLIGYLVMDELAQTPYMKALKAYSSPPYPIQNYGIRSAHSSVKGVFLTIDLCPSTKPFAKAFFDALVSLKQKIKKTPPIAISLSGLWALRHPKEFDWLIKQQRENNLDITWINHSFSHVYYHDLPLQENFLLSHKTKLSEEILAVEKMLLNKGQLPSVFIRLPGLVSNENLIAQLNRFGLIPVGSNAWLAKGERAKDGSIILVHGNSNEPQGIKLIMPQLTNSTPLNLLPLRQAFE